MFGDEIDCRNSNNGVMGLTTSRASRCVQIDTSVQHSGEGSYDDELDDTPTFYTTNRNNKPVNTGGSRRVQLQDNFTGDFSAQHSGGGSYDNQVDDTTTFYATSCKPVNLGRSRSVQLQDDSTGGATARTITCTFPFRSTGNPGKANQSTGALSGTSITKKARKVASVASRAVSRSRKVTHGE